MSMTLDKTFVDVYRQKEEAGINPLFSSFSGLGYVIYKRTYSRPVPEEWRTEEWYETVERVVNGAEAIGAGLTKDEMERLYDYIWNLKGFPAGRMLWQLGTENNERLGGDSLVNCWFVNLENVTDFGWMFERLMLGGGVGFSVTNPHRFGVVRQGDVVHEEGASDSDFIVPDKREGWADLLMRTIRCYLPKREDDYDSFTYSTALIRPEGAPIRTFGGVASGPGILVDGIEKICAILDNAVGRELTSVEVLDIANVIGAVVVSGNVRRSAQIALGSALDPEYVGAKRWDEGNIPPYRAMSNNSVYVNDPAELPEEFWNGYRGNGEPYGLVNLVSAQLYGRTRELRPDYSIEGFNPCAEIPLAHRESCNLSELVLPRITSLAEMQDLAMLLYKVQKAVAALPYLDIESDMITSENMRLGMGVTGVMQARDKWHWLSPTYTYLRNVDRVWSMEQGYPDSVRLTTVKPSGTLSLLAGVTSGGHPAFAERYIRRVRMASNDDTFRWCKEQGYPWEYARFTDGTDDHRTVVVEFPCSVSKDTPLADSMTAIEQLQIVQMLQNSWADNAVSVTVYYTLDELDGIRQYLSANWEDFKSVSFLLKENHGFDQPPLEPIGKDEYANRLVDIENFTGTIQNGYTADLEDVCETGACPIR